MTDEVSNLTASGFGIDVFGEDVEMSLRDDARFDGLRAVLALAAFSTRDFVARCGCTFLVPPLGITVSGGMICVCILVFTTSRGHVTTPANPPADAAVAISRPTPRSVLHFHRFAQFRSCS